MIKTDSLIQMFHNEEKETRKLSWYEYCAQLDEQQQVECLTTCFPLFSFYDWQDIVELKSWSIVLLDNPQLSIYSIMCQMYNELQCKIDHSHADTCTLKDYVFDSQKVLLSQLNDNFYQIYDYHNQKIKIENIYVS